MVHRIHVPGFGRFAATSVHSVRNSHGPQSYNWSQRMAECSLDELDGGELAANQYDLQQSHRPRSVLELVPFHAAHHEWAPAFDLHTACEPYRNTRPERNI